MLCDTCPSSQVDVVKVLAKAVKLLSNLSVGASGAGPRATDHFCRAQFSNICLNNRQTSTQKKLYLPASQSNPIQSTSTANDISDYLFKEKLLNISKSIFSRIFSPATFVKDKQKNFSHLTLFITCSFMKMLSSTFCRENG